MKWTAKKEAIIIEKVADWLSLDPEDRRPKTQKELAKDLGCEEHAIINIKKKIEQSQENSTGDEFADYMAKLEKLTFTRQGTSQDRKLYAQIKGWLVEKSEIKHEFELDATNYNKIATEVTERLRESYRVWGGICPVCSQSKTLRHEVRVDTESEHTEDREMATVALSVRPD